MRFFAFFFFFVVFFCFVFFLCVCVFSFFFFFNGVPLKSVLGRVAGVVHFVSGHEQSQLNPVCYFHFFGVFLAST